jgi:hypothetical protein
MSPAPKLPPLHVLSLDPAIGRKIVSLDFRIPRLLSHLATFFGFPPASLRSADRVSHGK